MICHACLASKAPHQLTELVPGGAVVCSLVCAYAAGLELAIRRVRETTQGQLTFGLSAGLEAAFLELRRAREINPVFQPGPAGAEANGGILPDPVLPTGKRS